MGPLMPKATALWLIENTTLTFEQIADFCHLHILEVRSLADGEVDGALMPNDPILHGQLLLEEIYRCEKDPLSHLQLRVFNDLLPKKKKVAKYTPLSKRAEKPDGVAWVLKNHPELSDSQVVTLIGTTKQTIDAIRHRTHRNSNYIKPRCPVTLGLCTQIDLDEAVQKARQNQENSEKTLTKD
jgi:hypothetical protein